MPRTVTTEQAPSAKPVGVSTMIGVDWAPVVDAPQYDVPVVGFGSARRIAPGAAEISSPLVVANVSEDNVDVFVKIVRASGEESIQAWAMPIMPRDALTIPLNGQFLISGDELHLRASQADSLSATISYTVGQAEEDDIGV